MQNTDVAIRCALLVKENRDKGDTWQQESKGSSGFQI
jgi:hypothetical protein